MYRPRRNRTGLAAYPGDAYYDPNRPSWMPFWIDTQTESNAKIAMVSGHFGGSVTPQEIINPGSVYTPPPQPPANPAVGAGTSTTPAPYTQAEYEAALVRSIAQQKALADAAALEHMGQVALNIRQSMQDTCPGKYLVENEDGSWSCPILGGQPWMLYGAIALAAVFAVSVVGGGTPRRYGR